MADGHENLPVLNAVPVDRRAPLANAVPRASPDPSVPPVFKVIKVLAASRVSRGCRDPVHLEVSRA